MKESDIVDNNLEQSQETAQPANVCSLDQLQQIHEAGAKLVEALKHVADGDLVGEIVANSLKLLRDQTNRGDMKLIDKSFKELRYALKMFASYRDVRKVSIFGSARTPDTAPDYQAAVELAKQMVAAGWMVITGAGGGIMAAGHGGAGAGPSFGLAIRLPFEQKTNPFIEGDPKLVNFKYFFTRKLMFVRSSHAIVCFPGGFGTMDEGFEVLTLIQTGKSVPMPVVLVDHPGGDFWRGWEAYVKNHLLARRLISPPDLNLFKVADSVEEAVQEVRHFYSNYHSIRYYRDELIVRVHRPLTDEQVATINEKFADLVVKGKFRASPALPIEQDEPALMSLPRLIFNFNRRDHGRFRELINHLNGLPA
ncbi:MAG TPA: TIGR00730 family Rossman fold protein [Humisphaera sp.]